MDTIPVFKFSTLDFPESERFRAWMEGNHCDCRLRSDASVTFDAESSGAALGPLFLSGRRWLNRKGSATYEIRRSERLIRTDGQDYFWICLTVDGSASFRSACSHGSRSAGHLYVADAAQLHEVEVVLGRAISLAVPRDFLPSHVANLHCHSLAGGIGRLLGDHLMSLFRNLSTLREQDVPHVVQSTLQLITAAVSPTDDTVREASSPIRNALRVRVQHYIDTHLLDRDLAPDRICRDIGLSRAKLYQLFEGGGGIMRQIQRKRLQRVYQVLADLSRPRAGIAEIAWRHGFSNEKYFYQLFKAEFGHTPTETLERAIRSPDRSTDERSKRAAPPVEWTLPWGVPA